MENHSKKVKKGKSKEIILCTVLFKALWNNRQLAYEKAFRLGKPDTFFEKDISVFTGKSRSTLENHHLANERSDL